MSPKAIFWTIMAVIVCIVLPICTLVAVCQQMRAQKRGDYRKRSAGGAGIGNALQELDRLVSRPSVEFTVEAERPLLKREDDSGGE